MATKVKKAKNAPKPADEQNPPPAAPDKMSEPEVTTVTPEPLIPADSVTVAGRAEPEPESPGLVSANPWAPVGWYPVTVVTRLSAVFHPGNERVKRERSERSDTGRTRADTPLWQGVPVTLVVRWLGHQGYTISQVRKGMGKLGVEISHGTANNEVYRGKQGAPLPELTVDQENALLDAVSAL